MKCKAVHPSRAEGVVAAPLSLSPSCSRCPFPLPALHWQHCPHPGHPSAVPQHLPQDMEPLTMCPSAKKHLLSEWVASVHTLCYPPRLNTSCAATAASVCNYRNPEERKLTTHTRCPHSSLGELMFYQQVPRKIPVIKSSVASVSTQPCVTFPLWMPGEVWV